MQKLYPDSHSHPRRQHMEEDGGAARQPVKSVNNLPGNKKVPQSSMQLHTSVACQRQL